VSKLALRGGAGKNPQVGIKSSSPPLEERIEVRRNKILCGLGKVL